jgi:hypothetical protein
LETLTHLNIKRHLKAQHQLTRIMTPVAHLYFEVGTLMAAAAVVDMRIQAT